MIKYLFSVMLGIISLYSVPATAQTPLWQWVKTGNCTGNTIYNRSICTDVLGNVYVTGAFSDIIYMGTTTVTSKGDADIFIAKYDSTGKLLWLKTIGSQGYDAATTICIDAQGYIYVGGSFSDSVQFGSIKLGSKGGQDIFIAKYNADGNVVWAKSAGGALDDGIGDNFGNGGITVDNKGHIYICGNYSINQPYTAADFGNISLNPGNMYNVMFVAKYDTSGNVIWAKSAGGNHRSTSLGGMSELSVDDLGNIFVVGHYSDSNCSFDSIKLTSANGGMFVVKYDSKGNTLWARQATGDALTTGCSIKTDKYGNCYMIGNMYNKSTDFGNGVLLLDSIAGTRVNGFIAKYDDSGQLLWAKNMNINPLNNNSGFHLILDEFNNIYIAGSFSKYSIASSDTIFAIGGSDGFIAKYDSMGNNTWFTHAGSGGGSSFCSVFGVTLSGDGSIYSTGYLTGNAGYFGSIVTIDSLINIFVAKLSTFPTGLPIITKNADEFSIYPNPSNNSATITTNSGSFTTLCVTDCVGRLVYTQGIARQKNVNINTAAFTSGLYFITASSPAGNVTNKLVVQH